MRRKRIVLIALIIIASVVLIDSGVRLYGFASAAANGVTIHTEPASAAIDAPGTVRFDYDVLSPLLCSTTCEATLIRHDTGAVIGSQNTSVLTSGTIEAAIGSESSLKRVPVQLVLTCTTEPTRYCSRASQTASDVSIVSFSLGEADAQRRASLISRQADVEARLTTELETLSGLAKLDEPYRELAERAERELPEHLDAVIAYRDAIEAERYGAQPPQTPPSIGTWDRETTTARFLENASRPIAQRLTALSAYRALLGDDAEAFSELENTYGDGRTAIEANETLAAISSQLGSLEGRYGSRIRRSAYEAAQDTIEQLTAACRIYLTDCPDRDVLEPTSVNSAYELSRRACELVRTYSIEDAKGSLAASRNLTLEDARTTYGVEAIRNASGFSAFENSAIENATVGPVNLTIGERLAIDVPADASLCGGTTHEPLTRTIPELEPDSYDVTLTIRGTHTCSLGSCDVEARTPIVFIHGHSFAEGTDPTSNLETMTDLAFALEEHGYLYAGHLFPSSERDLGTIDVPVSFTATYYLNSYVEDGTVKLASFKSEPIESYAIRLREDIEEARAIAGTERVIIVAHSMGGLVARSYLELFGDDHIERLIMVGTPNAGITARAQQLCPLLGAGLECRDMNEGSVFLRKLNSADRPDVPMHVIAGTGCDGGDGIVELESALLNGANATVVRGSCSGLDTLHAKLIEPDETPLTVTVIADLLDP